MSTRSRLVLGLAAAVSLWVTATNAQDTQSLGDVARQQRVQREKSKTAQDKDKSKDAKPSKVITNEEIPEHAVLYQRPLAIVGPRRLLPRTELSRPPKRM